MLLKRPVKRSLDSVLENTIYGRGIKMFSYNFFRIRF